MNCQDKGWVVEDVLLLTLTQSIADLLVAQFISLTNRTDNQNKVLCDSGRYLGLMSTVNYFYVDS